MAQQTLLQDRVRNVTNREENGAKTFNINPLFQLNPFAIA